MKKELQIAHMKSAFNYADLSYCQRKKVGCVIVKDDRIISIGYNGSLKGEPNVCEDENGNTLPEILHAESNSLMKVAKSHESTKGASVFVTCAPCLQCAKLLVQAEVTAVYYSELYRDSSGLELLTRCGILCAPVKI